MRMSKAKSFVVTFVLGSVLQNTFQVKLGLKVVCVTLFKFLTKMITELILFVVTCYLLYQLLTPKRPDNFPPGPPSYPIFGSGLFLRNLGKNASDAFSKLGEMFGPVTGLTGLANTAIVINGYEATKEFYAEDKFIARPKLLLSRALWNGRILGVVFSSGRLWQEQKRFTLRHLRDFGFGKTSMEGVIHEEAEECIKSFKKSIKEAGDSSVISVHDKFNVSLINILWAIIAGKRFSHDDDELKELLRAVSESLRSGNIRGISGALLNRFGFLRHFPYFKKIHEGLVRGQLGTHKLLMETIEEHENTFDPSAEPRDFIDIYLKAMHESKDDPDTTFFKDQLIQTLSDLFRAGSDTTANSIAFALLHLLLNPECQAKVHKELDDVVGRDRLPSYDDKPNLPYTFAVITESFRMSPIAPISVPHLNTEDVIFRGYTIPKNTFAMVNFPSTNMDKSYWTDPENFKPERFLDANGQFIKSKLDHVMGFGAGKRVCLGEPLARMTNFLLFTAVIQRFKFELVSGQPKPTTEATDGFTVAPHPFSAKVTARY